VVVQIKRLKIPRLELSSKESKPPTEEELRVDPFLQLLASQNLFIFWIATSLSTAVDFVEDI
jgi:hypothetical protein